MRAGTKTAQKSKTVLVVEDHEETLNILSRSLAAGGFDVVWARNGEDTLKLMERHPGNIDVMVIDVVLPGMSGPAVAEKVADRYPGIQVLYVSAFDGETVRGHGVDPEAEFFLAKPCEPADLVRAVNACIQR